MRHVDESTTKLSYSKDVMNEYSIGDLKLFDLRNFPDQRGNLLAVNFEELSLDLGIKQFVQTNVASSHRGVIRGMHWQNEPNTQGKLIIVLSGSIIDIAIDIKPNSSTFGQFTSVEMDEKKQKAFWIPPGFAHGFQTVSPKSKVIYLVDAPFDLDCSDGINPLDAELSLPWDSSIVPILSLKDRTAANFSQRFSQ